MPIVNALQVVLRGLAQIFLLRTSTAGALVLCGLLQASATLAAAAVLGSALGSGLALLLGQAQEDVHQGLHGYNAALAAMAASVFFQPSVLVLSLVFGAVVAIGLALQALRRWSLPVYTAPFVLALWCAWAVLAPMKLQAGAGPAPGPGELVVIDGLLHALAQVVFLQSVPAAMCVLCAIALESPRLALQALAASGLALLIGLLMEMPDAALAAGLAGFNAVLCVLALGRHATLMQTAVAASGATLLSLAAQRAGIPALTAPFMLCTWAVLWHRALARSHA
ncbi:urea transporter [uncultured Azohydromonas sp.]|jgi:Urea transporter|uniref:urea transporter n=1 Tax=uncultured Azohydromonas sp. TaxID=487342 RepID=UPI00261C74C1|nr:urea transporter [uncultured Azohydromonas sp.]